MSDISITQKPQQYSEIVYDSTATQRDNVFTSITDFFNAIANMAQGVRYLTIKQDVTAPAGAFDVSGCIFQGNNISYDTGGVTLTITTGTTLTFTGIAPKFTGGIRARSTSNTNVISSSASATYTLDQVATMQSTTAAFIKNTGSVQIVIAVNNSARFLNDGYENFETTAGAFASNIVLNYQLGIAFNNNTIRSTNAQVLIQVLDTVVVDASIYPTSHTNFSVGFAVNLNRSFSPNLSYVPVSKTANYTVTKANGYFLGNASGGSFTFTLPPALGIGYLLIFKKTDSSTNTVTIDGNSTETINGATTFVLTRQDDAVILCDSGSGTWTVVAEYKKAIQTYTPSNVTTDRSYDANSTTTDELADVLGTLIADLQAARIIG